jgi:hypothetical protein
VPEHGFANLRFTSLNCFCNMWFVYFSPYKLASCSHISFCLWKKSAAACLQLCYCSYVPKKKQYWQVRATCTGRCSKIQVDYDTILNLQILEHGVDLQRYMIMINCYCNQVTEPFPNRNYLSLNQVSGTHTQISDYTPCLLTAPIQCR